MLENAAVMALAAIALLVAAYFTYGRFLGRLFGLDPRRATPSHTMRDGVDYVPTRIPILFGHHFASIAGLGPILGPAIGVIWGWVPALLWVVLGSIFIGAVHDLGALLISLRHRGRSVGEVAYYLMGSRARLLSLLIIFFLMSVAMGAFCNTLADMFVNYNPDAIIPAAGLMVVAVAFGLAVYRLKVRLLPATLVAVAIFAGLIVYGVEQPVLSYAWFCSPKTQSLLEEAKAAKPEMGRPGFDRPYGARSAVDFFEARGEREAVAELGAINRPGSVLWKINYAWIAVLLGYAFLASILPVWLLLQPRDYINSFQLYVALLLLGAGLAAAAITGSEFARIDAPMVRWDIPDAPPMFPLLFVTIACGAASGFHSLVSSGTTVKQLDRESDAVPIGYGAMLTEAALAVLVIAACTAALSRADWGEGGLYAGWSAIGGGGLAMQLNAVVRGGANLMSQVGVPVPLGRTFIAVTVTAFALTTLDSATRLLRFNVEEIGRSLRIPLFTYRAVASLAAVLGIGFFAVVPAGKALWTLFGTTNQLLAGLALLLVSVYLYQHRRVVWYTLIPMLFMLGMTSWAMGWNLIQFYQQEKWSLFVTTVIVLVMAVWLVVEGVLAFLRGPVPYREPESAVMVEETGSAETAATR
ncbi:MAG: carbon starvation protein A [Thermogutta sp.]|nr:carbon starvation protein A [Thermogutta sp.]